jgi:peptide/nickel transport system permease protein
MTAAAGVQRATPQIPSVRRSRGRVRAMVAAALLLLEVAVWIAPSLFAPHDPLAQELSRRLKPPGFTDAQGQHFWLGTDALGRDVLSRLIYGARVSLTVGIVSVGAAAPLGTAAGLAAGYFGGWVDDLLMRLADVWLALPVILLAVSLMAVLGPGLRNVIVVLAISGWVLYARVVRSAVIAAARQDYVEAARASGARHLRVLWNHIFPNVISPIIVIATFHVAQMILLESTLSFLGLGVPPPQPTWGGLVSDGRNYVATAWWLSLFPGLAILVTVLAINIVGDYVRDVLDPRVQA